MHSDVKSLGPTQFGLVGAGKVGTVLAAALIRAGYPLTKVWDPSDVSIAKALNFLGPVAIACSVQEVVQSSNFTLMAVPDDCLEPLAVAIAANEVSLHAHVMAHVSGRYGYRVLEPLGALGAGCLALHPAMAFAGDPRADLDRVPGARFAVTSSDTATQDVGLSMVRRIEGVPVAIAENERVLYHAALTHGSNHLVTLVIQAADMLRAAGVRDTAAVLRPLLSAALENALERNAAGATGPIVRGDAATVSAHLDELSHRLPDTVPVYRTLSNAAVSIALLAKRISEEQAERLRSVLLD